MIYESDPVGLVVENVLVDQEKMLLAMKCIIGECRATYISGPITTGRNFVIWHNEYFSCAANVNDENYKHDFQSAVVRINEQTILKVAELIRSRQSRPVIEPGSLFVSGWRQKDYIFFWEKVLKNFVFDVVLVDGWQYSAGCVAEFMIATDCGYAIRSEAGQAVSLEIGRNLILNAISEIEKSDVSNVDGNLRKLADSLKSILLREI